MSDGLSDVTSEDLNECYSDISSEKSAEYVISSQRFNPQSRKSTKNFLQKLFIREITGTFSLHKNATQEQLFTTIPSWRRLSLLQVIPKSALQAGHIVMGLTQCGQFLITYTYSLDVAFGVGSLFKYLLHWWAFTPNRVARKVAEVTLFGNYSIYKELSIVIAQWPTERNKLVIHGLCSNWMQQQTDKAFLTITTVPSLNNCNDCQNVASSYEEDDLAANWDTCVRCNCLQHGLTVHTSYEVISPYPKFRAVVCLNYVNHVLINTGNFLHVLRVDLDSIYSKSQMCINKQTKMSSDAESLGSITVSALTVESCNFVAPESLSLPLNSPKCDSATIENDFNDEMVENAFKSNVLNVPSNKNNNVCDNINKFSSITLIDTSVEGNELQSADVSKDNLNQTEQPQIVLSIKEKILQDFCEDISQQELNISTELVTLIKHSPGSPRSVPQRFPSDVKVTSWISPMLSPPLDFRKTNNLESSQKNSQQSTTSNKFSCVSSSVPNLMSPPVSTILRHSRKRSNMNSTQIRARGSHKLISEAEKAYEFTDDSVEFCEKLSSFRKRRLADKKYEFCDEAEDAENIVPFKHVRNQLVKHNVCSVYQLRSNLSPLPGSDDLSNSQEININSDCNEKNVLQPLNQNQLPHLCRERSNKHYVNIMSPLVPKNMTLQHPIIKCTSHFKRSYIELDDEMTSVITDVEDEDTGCYASYQCVLPMQVHGGDYAQMGMINNAKAEKLIVPCVSIHQMSFDIETFSHHISDWICKLYKKKYWHCSDYDIEIVDVCALSGDVICLLIMKIQTSEQNSPAQCSYSSDDRKQYVAGCKFIWNIQSNQYSITEYLSMKEVRSSDLISCLENKISQGANSLPWNPTKHIVPEMRCKIQQTYARRVRFLSSELNLSGESITRLRDLDNLIELYITPLHNSS